MSPASSSSQTNDTPTNSLASWRSAEPKTRRRQTIFFMIYAVVAAMLTWPLFPTFAGIHPLIFGLPLSFAWVVAALLIMFFALIWLYLTEDHDAS